jgi:hypothetical protein
MSWKNILKRNFGRDLREERGEQNFRGTRVKLGRDEKYRDSKWGEYRAAKKALDAARKELEKRFFPPDRKETLEAYLQDLEDAFEDIKRPNPYSDGKAYHRDLEDVAAVFANKLAYFYEMLELGTSEQEPIDRKTTWDDRRKFRSQLGEDIR